MGHDIDTVANEHLPRLAWRQRGGRQAHEPFEQQRRHVAVDLGGEIDPGREARIHLEQGMRLAGHLDEFQLERARPAQGRDDPLDLSIERRIGDHHPGKALAGRGAQHLADRARSQQPTLAVTYAKHVVLLADGHFLHQHRSAPDAGDGIEGLVQLLGRGGQVRFVEAALDVHRVADLQRQRGERVGVGGRQCAWRGDVQRLAEAIEVGLGAVVKRPLAGQHAGDTACFDCRLQFDVVVQLRVQAGNQVVDRFALEDFVQAIERRLCAGARKRHEVGDIRSPAVMTVERAFQRVV